MLKLFSSKAKKFTIEFADRADLQPCADIHAASFSSAWGDGELAAMLNQKNTHCLALKTAAPHHPVAGFLMYRMVAGEAEILTIAIERKHRRSGYGGALLEEMIRKCLSERLKEIFLEVEATNLAALKLYKKLGFTKVGERKGYYKQSQLTGETPTDDTSEETAGDAYIMRLDLVD